MAAFPRVPTVNATSYTLDAQIAAGGNTITLNSSVAGIVRAPGYCWIDRVDASGNETPTKREYKKFTGVSGVTLTGVTSADGTDQVHAVGAIVEFGPTVNHENDLYDALKIEHADTGVHTTALVTTLKATGAEVTTGTEDAKIVTPKALADAGIVPVTVPVKATGAEIDTGTDDAKFATPKAIADAKLGRTWATHDPTVVGFTGAVTKQVRYVQIGKTVTVHGIISGTSDSASFTITLPVTASANVGNCEITCIVKDNGTYKTGTINVASNATTAIFGNGVGVAGSFTTSGAKSCQFEITYECV